MEVVMTIMPPKVSLSYGACCDLIRRSHQQRMLTYTADGDIIQLPRYALRGEKVNVDP